MKNSSYISPWVSLRMFRRFLQPSGSTFSRNCSKVSVGNNHDDWRRPKDWSDAVHVGDIFLKIRGFVGPRDEKQIQSQFSSVGVKDQNELPPRSPKDSFSKAVLPLSSDVRFRRKCVTVFNGVRFGRILELMDAFAGLVAYRYVLNPAQISPSPFVLVTALVDRIVTRYGHGKNCVAAISANEDIFLSGFVSWVGKSSIEILVDVWQNDSLVTDAAFVFVSRDPVGLGPTPVNPLKIESPEDQHYFSKGAANTEMRKRFEENNLFRTLPNKEESELLHRQFLASVESRVFRGETDNRLVAARGGIYARDTQSENVMICHPEDKNLNNKIFGGRMMRQAFEHAWGVAMLHCRGRPRLVCIDDIWFRKPVDIGSLVQFVALICYTEDCNMVVRVDARVLDPTTGQGELTNTFYMTFRSHERNKVRPVFPKSYFDCVLHLDGKRHYEKALEAVKLVMMN